MTQLLDQFGRTIPTERNRTLLRLRSDITRSVRAKYDSAQTNSQNELHWANADDLSPNSANSLAVRKKIRSRARYETFNNGYIKGIVGLVCNDVVGSGPKLQLTDSRFTKQQQTAIERTYNKRANRIKLRRKLWQLQFAEIVDGESFAVRFTDQRLKDRNKANLKIIETDQVTSPNFKYNVNEVDGVRIDAASGEPESYFIASIHPGEVYNPYVNSPGNWVDAEHVCHLFRRERNWIRGISHLSPSLPLCALLRRYTLAVVQNAEIAADFTVLMQTQANPYQTAFPLTDGQPTSNPSDWFDSFPIDKGLMTVIPDGYDLKQLDPKQPVTVYDAFVNALIQEIARPLAVPRNMALGNSGQYNMASGTLDRQIYRAAVEQHRLAQQESVLDVDFESFWQESILLDDYYGTAVTGEPIDAVLGRYTSLRLDEVPEHSFIWDDLPEHTDPDKVASAINKLWLGGHISDKDIQEKRFNRSTETHYENMREQRKARAELDMPLPLDSSQYTAGAIIQQTEQDQQDNQDTSDGETEDASED